MSVLKKLFKHIGSEDVQEILQALGSELESSYERNPVAGSEYITSRRVFRHKGDKYSYIVNGIHTQTSFAEDQSSVTFNGVSYTRNFGSTNWVITVLHEGEELFVKNFTHQEMEGLVDRRLDWFLMNDSVVN